MAYTKTVTKTTTVKKTKSKTKTETNEANTTNKVLFRGMRCAMSDERVKT